MTRHPWPHLYQLLEVHHEAPRADIQDAFLARHAEAVDDPQRRMALTEAWEVLGDDHRRAAYDRQPTARLPLPLPSRELAAAVRPLAVWLGFFVLGCLAFVFIGARDVSAIVGAGVLTACAPAGWRVLGHPLRWLELDLLRGAGLVRLVLAISFGPFVAPVVVAGPIVRWIYPRRADLARRVHSCVTAAPARRTGR